MLFFPAWLSWWWWLADFFQRSADQDSHSSLTKSISSNIIYKGSAGVSHGIACFLLLISWHVVFLRDGRCQETSGPCDTWWRWLWSFNPFALELLSLLAMTTLLTDSHRWQLFSFNGGWQTEFINRMKGPFLHSIFNFLEGIWFFISGTPLLIRNPGTWISNWKSGWTQIF